MELTCTRCGGSFDDVAKRRCPHCGDGASQQQWAQPRALGDFYAFNYSAERSEALKFREGAPIKVRFPDGTIEMGKLRSDPRPVFGRPGVVRIYWGAVFQLHKLPIWIHISELEIAIAPDPWDEETQPSLDPSWPQAPGQGYPALELEVFESVADFPKDLFCKEGT
jgi:hypothetical protein